MRNSRVTSLVIVSYIGIFSAELSAEPSDWAPAELKEFGKDSVLFMNSFPTIVGEISHERRATSSEWKSHVLDRQLTRRGNLISGDAKSVPGNNDSARDLVGMTFPFVSGIEAIGKEDLMKSAVVADLWSGDYWATFKGGIATRYGDEAFPANSNWIANYDYILKNPVDKVLMESPENMMNHLSPAEKYDLLIGASSKEGLANYSWREGKQIFDRQGKVEGWFGICHGWSPAAFSVNRPSHEIKLMSSDGKIPLTFSPDDIKALTSLWWARSSFPVRFVGGRCESENPAIDPVTGRVIDLKCLDTNPATWHLSIVNLIGRAKQSFVMDASYDRQVWNQPLKSYSYSFFNPQTHQMEMDWRKATIPLSSFTPDKFHDFRSTRTKSVVGVAMEVSYVAETYARLSQTNSVQDDNISTVQYLYDLELDSAGDIIGGEWYRNVHPDFLWIPQENTQPSTLFDRRLTSEWDLNSPIPSNWQPLAKSAAQAGYVYAPIIEYIEKVFSPR